MVKVLIVLLWLAVPVTGYYLARADYYDYLNQTRVQRADCLNRADVLGRYTRLIGQRASTITTIVDPNSRTYWQSRWRTLKRELSEEQLKLRRDPPVHYAGTDAQLTELEQLLESQREAVEEAVRERDAYNKAGGGLEEMLLEIKRAEGIADYYRSIGAQGIYELIRDDARTLQSEYRERVAERDQRNNKMVEKLAKAEECQSEIIEGLQSIESKLGEDEQTTYSNELRERFDSFSLPRELARVLGLPYKEQS
jgi:hypothetical protein